ncbi:MAG: HIT domain-containing protein [Deltaproteobacteria bacterium]|nr:HIT domain-containing protein [Deltaproteobacteria bacterium]
MQHLWAPWRMTYIDSVGDRDGCIFCDQPKAPDLRLALVLGESSHSVIMLNKYPYNNGHLLIAPKRHESQLFGLPQEEYQDLCRTLKASMGIVARVLNPGGMNLGMNVGRCAGAGVEAHLHWHIVPRWEGDTNFMPVMAETRVMPQHLLDSYDRFSPFFREFLAGKDDQGS